MLTAGPVLLWCFALASVALLVYLRGWPAVWVLLACLALLILCVIAINVLMSASQ